MRFCSLSACDVVIDCLVAAIVSIVPNEYILLLCVLLVVSIVVYERLSFICDVFCSVAGDLCFVSCLVCVLGIVFIILHFASCWLFVVFDMSKRVKRTKEEGIVSRGLCQGSAGFSFISGMLTDAVSGADGIRSPLGVGSLSLSGLRMTCKAVFGSDTRIFSVLSGKKSAAKGSDSSSEDVGVSDGSKFLGTTTFGGVVKSSLRVSSGKGCLDVWLWWRRPLHGQL